MRGKLGFDFVQQKPGFTAAYFICARCPEELWIHNVSGQAPEVIASWARKKGWVCSASRKSNAMCPKCQIARVKNDTESELRKFVPKEFPPFTGETAMAEAPKLTIVAPVPTGDQRVAIRNLLDKNFDDSTGRYLDGYSDRVIGEKVGIGAMAVKIIREAAYGELIETDPELEWLTKELCEIKSRLKNYEERLTKYAAAKQK